MHLWLYIVRVEVNGLINPVVLFTRQSKMTDFYLFQWKGLYYFLV